MHFVKKNTERKDPKGSPFIVFIWVPNEDNPITVETVLHQYGHRVENNRF